MKNQSPNAMIQGLNLTYNLLKGNKLETEAFQNSVIRPIVKMQHRQLLLLTSTFLKVHHKNIHELSIVDQLYCVLSLFEKNQNLKNQVIGLIIAHFTEAEMEEYFAYQKEYNRRITEIASRRARTNLIELLNVLRHR